jgi:DnaJ-class molecular chaperone
MGSDPFRPTGDSMALLTGDDGARGIRVDCFADEVVIDFPSVASAVERMRSAFVDEDRGAPLRADVSLSTREASDGITLPLDVPVRSTCRSCGGRGETWSERCARCAGTGAEVLRHHVQVSVPAGVLDGTRFRFVVTTRHDPPTRIELHVAVR